MPTHSAEQIYAAVRAILPELEEGLRQQAETLLAQAERGQAADLALLDLFSQDEFTRQRLRTLLKPEAAKRLLGDYSPLPGVPVSTPGERYACPVEGCNYQYVIGEAGEQPPHCPRHHVALKRKE